MIPIETEELNGLIEKIKNRDMDALEKLYQQMKDSIFGLALVYTKSLSDADDVVHDTILAVWNHADQFRGGNPKAWIITIARNYALKCIKQKNRFAELDDGLISEDFRDRVGDAQLIENMLRNLNENEREIVMLYSYGFSHAEIAKITGRTYSGVRWKYSNAIKKLIRLTGGES